MQELTEYGLIQKIGVATQSLYHSALNGDGIDDLLEMIGLVAEVQN